MQQRASLELQVHPPLLGPMLVVETVPLPLMGSMTLSSMTTTNAMAPTPLDPATLSHLPGAPCALHNRRLGGRTYDTYGGWGWTHHDQKCAKMPMGVRTIMKVFHRWPQSWNTKSTDLRVYGKLVVRYTGAECGCRLGMRILAREYDKDMHGVMGPLVQ